MTLTECKNPYVTAREAKPAWLAGLQKVVDLTDNRAVPSVRRFGFFSIVLIFFQLMQNYVIVACEL